MSAQIQDLDAKTVAVGDSIEQAGVPYTVSDIAEGVNGFGRRVDAIYLTWDGAAESDTFRSVVNARGFAGQIRWHAPYGMNAR